jgi:hypothetical protein
MNPTASPRNDVTADTTGLVDVATLRTISFIKKDLFGYEPPDHSASCDALRRRLNKERDLIEKWEAIADHAIAEGRRTLDADWLLGEYKHRHKATCTRVIRTGIMRVLLAKRPDLRRLYKAKRSKHFDGRPRP